MFSNYNYGSFLPVPRDISNIIVSKLEPPDVVNVAGSNKSGLFGVLPIIKSYCNDPITVREIESYIRNNIEENKEIRFSVLDGYGRYAGRSQFPDMSKNVDPIISIIQIFKDERDVYVFLREIYALKTGIITKTNDSDMDGIEQSIPVVAFIKEERGIYKGLNKLIELPHNILLDKDTSISIYARRHICDRDILEKLLIDKYKEFFKRNEDALQEYPIMNFTLPGAIRREEMVEEYLAYNKTTDYGTIVYELCDLKEARNTLYMALFRCDLELLRYQVYSE